MTSFPLGNYLIGLREGLEASLVVVILIAYLVKTGRRELLPRIWAGVAFAVIISFAFGALLTFGSSNMSFQAKEAFGGVMSILAVGLVTWMIFWMRRTARHLKSDLHGRLDKALLMGPAALAVVAAISVGREGLETALFLWTNVKAAGNTTDPIIGAILGLVLAAGLGYLFYRGALTLNLVKFFTYTGAALVVVAAGTLAYGIHDLQEAGWIGGIAHTAFDISATIRPDSWVGTLLKGALNFQPNPTVAQAIAWVAYVVPVMTLFFLGGRARSAPKPAAPSVTEPTRSSVTA